MSQAITSGAAASAPPDDDVTLVVAGKQFGGWQDIAITRGLEIMPGHFDVALTELYPGQASAIDIQPTQSVVVKAGKDTLITGYIDRYVSRIGPEGHDVRIMGRGKCADLVDCSAGIIAPRSYKMQIAGQTAFSIAQTLAQPFGINVTESGVENDLPIPVLQIIFGETPYEIIDRISRYRGLLAYEGTDGNLILGTVGTANMASGFAAPGNVIGGEGMLSADQRFSDYIVSCTSTDTLNQIRPGASVVGYAIDTATPTLRFRPRAMVSEQTMIGLELAQRRANWEMNRRNGRSQMVSLTCDSWRDGKGKLWEPNRLAPVDIPACKIRKQNWIIAQVTFRKGQSGTQADLVLMPPGAFSPEPGALAGVNYQLQDALTHGAQIGPVGPGGIAGHA